MATRSLTLSAWTARRLPDQGVLERALRGDPVAFSEIYRRYQRRVYGFCLARSLDPDAAADATQEVFMKLLRAEPGSIADPQAWLFTVARNVVIDVLRKRDRTQEDSGIDEESLAWDRLKSADTADEVLARADARNVFLALRGMRPRYRTALVMREIHGESAKDMAEALATSPGAVDTLVSRARDAFGVAYAAVSDLSPTCRASVALIYRSDGTGITEQERSALRAHLAECDRCRTEAKRAHDPRHLAALLPFLVPAKRIAHGLLDRAALTVRMFPDAVAQQGAAVATQPHAWDLITKIVAGVAAVAVVTAPIAVTTLRHPAATSAPKASVGRSWSSTSHANQGMWDHWSSMGGHTNPMDSPWSSGGHSAMSGSADSMGTWTSSGWSGDMMHGSGWSAPASTASKTSTSKHQSSSTCTSGSRSTSSGSTHSGSSSSSDGGSWSSGSGSHSSGGDSRSSGDGASSSDNGW